MILAIDLLQLFPLTIRYLILKGLGAFRIYRGGINQDLSG
jgi:hypothetical protein